MDHQTVAWFQSDKFDLPAFFLRPSSFRHRVGTVFSAAIHFPAHPAFASQTLLSGNDETRVHNLFSDAALSFFEGNPGWSAEASGGQLFFYADDYLVPPQDIPWFVNEALRVLNLIHHNKPVYAPA